MGAITDFAQYKDILDKGYRRVLQNGRALNAAGVSTITGTSWNVLVNPTNPSTPVTYSNADSGSLLSQPPLPDTSNQLYIAHLESGQQSSQVQYGYTLIDILSAQGGLVGNVATEQTTNLPTAALTRYTNGVGVMIGLVILTSIGGTSTTITASYTNQAGVSGRITPAIAWGSTSYPPLLYILPLADGDTGVRSVESVTLAASTGTAGNIGVMLFKPLFMVPRETKEYTELGYGNGLACGRMIEIRKDAYLSMLAKSNNTNYIQGQLTLADV